jgi:hypothetical protein
MSILIHNYLSTSISRECHLFPVSSDNAKSDGSLLIKNQSAAEVQPAQNVLFLSTLQQPRNVDQITEVDLDCNAMTCSILSPHLPTPTGEFRRDVIEVGLKE